MDNKEKFTHILQKYLPLPSLEPILELILKSKVVFKITKKRATKLGDYRPPQSTQTRHQITINNDLNPYGFLITTLHELAHLQTFEQHQSTKKPHGQEWKQNFKAIMNPFVSLDIFPQDVHQALQNYMNNPKASSCSDPNLLRALRKHDTNPKTSQYLEDLPFGARFKIENGELFAKGEKQRTRYLCQNLNNQKMYLVPKLLEVDLMP